MKFHRVRKALEIHIMSPTHARTHLLPRHLHSHPIQLPNLRILILDLEFKIPLSEIIILLPSSPCLALPINIRHIRIRIALTRAQIRIP